MERNNDDRITGSLPWRTRMHITIEFYAAENHGRNVRLNDSQYERLVSRVWRWNSSLWLGIVVALLRQDESMCLVLICGGNKMHSRKSLRILWPPKDGVKYCNSTQSR